MARVASWVVTAAADVHIASARAQVLPHPFARFRRDEPKWDAWGAVHPDVEWAAAARARVSALPHVDRWVDSSLCRPVAFHRAAADAFPAAGAARQAATFLAVCWELTLHRPLRRGPGERAMLPHRLCPERLRELAAVQGVERRAALTAREAVRPVQAQARRCC